MKQVVKQVAGIDVAKDELVVQLAKMHEDWTTELYASRTFSNTQSGFESLVAWVNNLSQELLPVRYVMEATGVYHESLAYYLDENGNELSIVLPNKISNYMRTLEKKTITDRTCAEAIALFGLERNLHQWTRPTGIYPELRKLTRERGQLIEMRTICKNQLHAEKAEARPSNKSMNRLRQRIDFLNKQEQEITAELKQLLQTNQQAKDTVSLLCSIPGIGLLTAASVLGETNGFDLIKNKRQLTSYAGLDVRDKQSGTSVKGKSKISKKGNKYLRKTMYLPGLTAIRHNQRYKAIYQRLVSRHGIKMKAAVAVQRKLLEMMFTIYKKQEPYNKNYINSQLPEAIMDQKN